MKRWIALLLACVLCLTMLTAGAESGIGDIAFDRGGLEMLRQYYVRQFNPAYNFAFNRNMTADYPTGIILDEDDHVVRIVAKDTSLTLALSDEEGAMEIAAGYAAYAAMFALADGDPDVYRRKDGAFTPLTINDMGHELRAYLDLTSARKLQYWCSLRRFPEDEDRDIIGRIMGNRGCACVIDGAELYDDLFVADLPEAIILMEDTDILSVQSENTSYLFSFSDGFEEAAMAFAMFNVLMGGVELEDMLVIRVYEDPEDPEGFAVSLVSVPELYAYLEHFYDHWDLGA